MEYVISIGEGMEMLQIVVGCGFCAHLYDNLCVLCPPI